MTYKNLESITIYHDDSEKPEKDQRISVGITVPEGTTVDGDINIMEIPAGKYLVGEFEIFPNQYGEAWTETFSYLNENNLMPVTEPMYESYLNEPGKHPEGKHLVNICIALPK